MKRRLVFAVPPPRPQLSGDTRAHVCSFLDPFDLSRATSVSKDWQLVRQRPWAANMLQRGDKQAWCLAREKAIESGYDGTTGDLVWTLARFEMNSEDNIVQCDQKYFTDAIVGATGVFYSNPPAAAASKMNPFKPMEGSPAWSYGCSHDLAMIIAASGKRFNALLPIIVKHVDRLSLAEFKRLWGSWEDGDVTKEQSIEFRRQRLSWLEGAAPKTSPPV